MTEQTISLLGAAERVTAAKANAVYTGTTPEELALHNALLAGIDLAADHLARIAGVMALVPIEPTEAMLNAARDWSVKRHGMGIGNCEAKGCWSAMLTAATAEDPAK